MNVAEYAQHAAVEAGVAMRNAPLAGVILLLTVLVTVLANHAYAQPTYQERGFTLEVVTDSLPAARQIAVAEDGTLFVGSSTNCRHDAQYTSVYAVVPHDDRDAELATVDQDLRCPTGVTLRGDDLYVVALNRVLRYRNIADEFRNSPRPEVITADLPNDPHYGWRHLTVGPDGYLYVAVGAPCNHCVESDERYAAILRMNPDTGASTVYAHGVRNSLGMAWHPVTNELWFSDNGADGFGDDLPADEINRVRTPGGHYGFPYFHQDHNPGSGETVDFRDPEYGVGKNAADYLRSEHLLQAHSAALGITFYDGDQFPSYYCGAMFIAEHGSMDRHAAGRVGYRVSVLRFADTDSPPGRGAVLEPLVEWQVQDTHDIHNGRPADVAVDRDGSLLITDDDPSGGIGALYRLRYFPRLSDTAPTGCPDTAHISTFAPASHETRQGFVRLVNRGESPSTVQMHAFDDAGQRHGPVTLTLGAGEATHFNSSDLEEGNENKGLSGMVGTGSTDWRIELHGDGVETLSYMRTGDGFVTSLHDVAPLLEPVVVSDSPDHTRTLQYRYDVPIFNPGRNIDQMSSLRLVNPGENSVAITITAIDDAGEPGENAATLTLAGGSSRAIAARDLESGDGLDRRRGIGTGTGKWRLVVESDGAILVASLLASPTGHLTNLSTVPDNKTRNATSTSHLVPLFPAHGDPNDRQGFVRVINRSDVAGTVEIAARDDTHLVVGTLTLDLGPNESVHFNSAHLEHGDDDKGWAEGVGGGEGDWRLTLTSELDVDVLAYIRRTSDGFLTSMHDFVRRTAIRNYEVPFFNPGRNTDQVSKLCILNTGELPAFVRITGTDDAGTRSGRVDLTVPNGTAITYSSLELEAGAVGLRGALGTGAGKWRLTVTSEQPIRVMSLLESQGTGHLTNLSTVSANQPWQWDR